MVGYEDSRPNYGSSGERCPECGHESDSSRSKSSSQSRGNGGAFESEQRRGRGEWERDRADRAPRGTRGNSDEWDRDYASRRLQDSFEQGSERSGSDRGRGSSDRGRSSAGAFERNPSEWSGSREGYQRSYEHNSPSFNPSNWTGAIDRDFGGGAGWSGGTPLGLPMSGTPRSLGENFGMSTHRGKGPKGYRRADTTVHEEVCDALTDDHHLDASNIECSVSNGEVTLTGTVGSREDKRRAEDIASRVSGVSDVQNKIRVQREDSTKDSALGTRSTSGEAGYSSTTTPSSSTSSASSSKTR